MVHPFHKEVDQFSQYLITHGFHFNNLPGLVHILDGVLIQAVQRGGQFRAVYQGLFQPSLQQVFLVVHETVHGGLNAFADGERAHIMDAGIFFLFCFQFPDITELGFRQERAEQIPGGSKSRSPENTRPQYPQCGNRYHPRLPSNTPGDGGSSKDVLHQVWNAESTPDVQP